MRIVMILLFWEMLRMHNYTCDSTDYFHQNVNGNITTTWKFTPEGWFITDCSWTSLISSDHDNADIYVIQKGYSGASAFTFITIFDGSLNLKRKKLYHGDYQFFDKPHLDHETGHLHMILNYTSYLPLMNATAFVEFSEKLHIERWWYFNNTDYDLNSLSYQNGYYTFLAKHYNDSYYRYFWRLTINQSFPIYWFEANFDPKIIISSKSGLLWTHVWNKGLSYYVSLAIVDDEIQTNQSIDMTKVEYGNIRIKHISTDKKDDENNFLVALAYLFTNIFIFEANYQTSDQKFVIPSHAKIPLTKGNEITNIILTFNTYRRTWYIHFNQTGVRNGGFLVFYWERSMPNKNKIYYLDDYIPKMSNVELYYTISYNRWIYLISRERGFFYGYIFTNRIYDYTTQNYEIDSYSIDSNILSSYNTDKISVNVNRSLVDYANSSASPYSWWEFHTNKPKYETVAFNFEQSEDPIVISLFNKTSSTKTNQSWTDGKSEIKFTKNCTQEEYPYSCPDWLNVDHKNGIQTINTTRRPFKERKIYNFQVITEFQGYNYTNDVTLDFKRWKVDYWIKWHQDIDANDWTEWMRGYNLNYNNTQCEQSYDQQYASILSSLMYVIAITITFGFITLVLIRNKMFMHAVVYLENHVLSMTIVGFFYQNYHIKGDPYKIKYETNDFGYFSYDVPFSPFSSSILQIPVQIGYLDSDMFTLSERLVLKILLLLIGFILLWAFLCLIIFAIHKLWGLSTIYKNATNFMKLLLQLLIWYIFWTNAVWMRMVYALWLYAFFDFRAFNEEILSNGYVYWFSILYSAIFSLLFPYLYLKLIEDFAEQISLGESYFRNFTQEFAQTTKGNVKCKSFYILWLIKIYVWAVPYVSIFMIPKEFTLYAILIWTILWMWIVMYVLPFKDGSLNFAVVFNQIALCFMYIIFFHSVFKRYDDRYNRLYYDNLMVAAFAVGTTSIGTFMAIAYKLACHATNLIKTIYSRIRAFLIKTYSVSRRLCRSIWTWIQINLRTWIWWKRWARQTGSIFLKLFKSWSNWIRRCIWKFWTKLQNWLCRKNIANSQEEPLEKVQNDSKEQFEKASTVHQIESDTEAKSNYQESSKENNLEILIESNKINDSDAI